MKKLILSLAVIAVIFAGCKKDSEPTKTELLAKEWKVIDIGGESVMQYFEVDEITLKFETDGVLKVTSVLDGFSETVTGNWKWENNEEILKVVVDGEQIPWELYKLTETEFWFLDTDEAAIFKCVPK